MNNATVPTSARLRPKQPGAAAPRPASHVCTTPSPALARLRREGLPVSVAAVGRRATVSRTFLYANPQVKAAVSDAMAEAGDPQSRIIDDQDAGHEATWRERALNAEEAVKAARTEVVTQRTRIGELLGQIRSMKTEWAEESIQRITTENTTLKQQFRQLTADNRSLDERLEAARSNTRFQDRRIADLEARLTDPAPSTRCRSPNYSGHQEKRADARIAADQCADPSAFG